jgi:hypothetical protein
MARNREQMTKIELGREILLDLLAGERRILIRDAIEAGLAAGVSKTTIGRAARELGVRTHYNGRLPGFWSFR